MDNRLLAYLENDANLTHEQLALMLDKEVGDIKKMILEYEKSGVILGYKTLIDWDKTDREYVTAIIEIKTSPQPERGFDRIAEKIANPIPIQAAPSGRMTVSKKCSPASNPKQAK